MGSLKMALYWLVAIVAFVWCFVTVAQFSRFVSSQGRGVAAVKTYKLQTNEELMRESTLALLVWNCLMLVLFILPHSLLTTRWWRNRMEDLELTVIQRSIYVMITSYTLQTLMTQWTLIPIHPMWFVDLHGRWILSMVIGLLHCVCWILIYAAALTMDLPEMLGIKQVYYESRGMPSPIDMKTVGTQRLYRHMRHPGAVCLLLVLWCHPVMTIDRLLLALTLSLYILCGHGVTIRDYIYVKQEMTNKQVRIQRRSVNEHLN